MPPLGAIPERRSMKPLKDAALAALVAAILGLPLIGFRLVDQAGGETLATRWHDLAYVIVLAFIGRLALVLTGDGPSRGATAVKSALTPVVRPVGAYLPWLLIVFAVILPALPFANRGVIDSGILILTYVLLGWGLNIVTGLARV